MPPKGNKCKGEPKRKRNKKQKGLDLSDDERIKAVIIARQKATEEKIANLGEEKLRQLLYTVVSRQPSMVFHLLDELENEKPPDGDNPDPPPTPGQPWCI